MPRCAIYARFSSDLQSETSAEDQVRDCRARAEREGWEIAEVYTDHAISGASNRRPGMTAMLVDVAAGAFEIILAEDLDRLARDQEDIAGIYKRVSFAGAKIYSLSVGEVNELHIGLKGTMDALELKKLAEKIRRGQRGCVERGRVPGGLCYGYEVVRQMTDRGEVDAGLRRIVPEQAEVVLRILREYAAGRGPRAIAKALNADGVPAAQGGEWAANAIVGNRARAIGILHNPIYIGQLVYNRVRMVRDPDTRKRISRVNPRAEWKIVEIPELRIVDDALWQSVQDRLGAYETAPLVRRRRPLLLLSGLVRCGVCGGPFVSAGGGKWGCNRHREKGTCTANRQIRREDLQRRVLAGLKTELLSPEAVSLLVREYHLERDRQLQAGNRDRRVLERKLTLAEQAVDRLVAAVAAGGSDFVDIRQALARKTAERDELRAAIGEEEAIPVIVLHPRIAEAYRERVEQLVDGVDDGEISDETVGGQIRALIDSVRVSPLPEGGVTIEVTSSLQSAVALATADTGTRSGRGAHRTLMVVAEEGLEPPTPGL